ncbi:fructokinase [Methylopila capsulata]|uniref:Fructokinase n=1 Tax=Methylopila capsulata TaxID=61654 RepID=A0A9W6MTJ4_9HYPH|nr:ROK family protein [Methylopila capsulata]MBM7853610.1 fructokinase [Methylopila capsulata]GLK57176.1 fructokinase [Methylopila capsulata]
MLIGIDWGGTKIEAIALDESGATLLRERAPTPRDDYGACVRTVAGLVARFESALGATGSVGVGMPGSLSPATGLLRNANSTWLNGRPLKQDLETALGRPVRLQNDANCLAVSEATDGAAAGAAVAFAVVVGTGCGAGVAIGGRPWAGRQAIAGEFGHNPLPWASGTEEAPGPLCWCGQRGCVETFVSGSGFARAHALTTGVAMSAEAVVAAARGGDADAAGSLSVYVDRLGRALATVVNLLDPDVIVLGGGMSNVSELYEGLPAVIASRVFSDGFSTPIRPAAHGDSSGVRGAAWLWKP